MLSHRPNIYTKFNSIDDFIYHLFNHGSDILILHLKQY